VRELCMLNHAVCDWGSSFENNGGARSLFSYASPTCKYHIDIEARFTVCCSRSLIL
jgi:hypothetical protein